MSSHLYWLMSRFCFGFAAVLLPCLLLAIYDERASASFTCSMGFFLTILTSLCIGFLLHQQTKKKNGLFLRKQAILMVVLIWIGASLIGAMPYFFCGVLKSPVDALFESVSGFTTTGSTILTAKIYDPQGNFEIPYVRKSALDKSLVHTFYGTVAPVHTSEGELKEGIEALPRALLLWRSLTQWLGGGGIVVLFLTLVPLAGVGNKVLFQSEVTGPSKEGVTPRIKETARILWKIYLGISLLQLATTAWLLPEIGWFDSLSLMLSTVSTGGFCTHSSGIAYFQNKRLEWLLMLFMVLGSVNFYLIFHLIKRRFHKLFDIEFLLFFFVVLAGSLCGTYFLQGCPIEFLDGEKKVLGLFDTIRTSSFHFISLMTSTGFASANFDLWPIAFQMILLISMYLGGMSGSTTGGIKVIRVYIFIRYCFFRIKNLLQPETVEVFRLHGHEIDTSTISLVFAFFGLVILSILTGTFFYALNGLDMESAFAFTACSLNNTGQGFRLLGPTESCALLSSSSKLMACFQMLLGRLEYFTLLMVMIPAFYRR
jgi:trk system potassium uptake protein TrkH